MEESGKLKHPLLYIRKKSEFKILLTLHLVKNGTCAVNSALRQAAVWFPSCVLLTTILVRVDSISIALTHSNNKLANNILKRTLVDTAGG